MKKNIKKVKMLAKIKQEIKKAKNILLSAYHRFDGDAVGCELAMFWALRKIKKTPLIFNFNMKKNASQYKFLDGFEYIETDLDKINSKKYDLIITFDSGEFPDLDKIKNSVGNPLVLNIDHHKTSSFYGDINWVDSKKAATGELVYELLKALKIKLNAKIAKALFVSISTDTGRFTFPNTTHDTFVIAGELTKFNIELEKIYLNLYCNKTLQELQLQSECISRLKLSSDGKVALIALPKEVFEKVQFYPQDFQEYIDMIKSINGVEVALLLREEKDKIRISIRTNGKVDASLLAEKFDGGGHSRAAGCTISDSLDSAVAKVLNVLNYTTGFNHLKLE